MDTRIARMLAKTAQEHAPHLLQGNPILTETDLHRMVRDLAAENVLVLAAHTPAQHDEGSEDRVRTWVSLYAQFYDVFASALFSSVSQHGLTAKYVQPEDPFPPVVKIIAQTTPVLEAMAGFVVPFVVRGQQRTVPERDYFTLFDAVCEELACTDLPPMDLQRLRNSAVHLLREMVALPIRQQLFNDFDRVLFVDEPPPRRTTGPLSRVMTPAGGLPPLPHRRTQNLSQPAARPSAPPPPPPTIPERPPARATGPMPVVDPNTDSQRLTDSKRLDDNQRVDDTQHPDGATRQLPFVPGRSTDHGDRPTRRLPVPDLPPLPNSKTKKT